MTRIILIIVTILFTILIINATAYVIGTERKLLAFVQRRVGPSIWGKRGALQVAADVLKALNKRIYISLKTLMFWTVLVLIMLLYIQIIYFELFEVGIQAIIYEDLDSVYLLQLFLTILLSLSIFAVGEISSSLYGRISSIREIFIDIVCNLTSLVEEIIMASVASFEIENFTVDINILNIFILGFSLFSGLLDLFLFAQRSPVDFLEPESELVAGYNIEYSGPFIIIIYFSEYLHILDSVITIVTSYMFITDNVLVILLGMLPINFSFDLSISSVFPITEWLDDIALMHEFEKRNLPDEAIDRAIELRLQMLTRSHRVLEITRDDFRI